MGTGIHDHDIANVIGVTKAYATRVGEGPMPTELLDKQGDSLREIGGEYGTTTGRPRRCGWIDLPATRYGILVTGARSIALMKLDVLDTFKIVKVCVGYKIGNKTIPIPDDMDADTLKYAKPVYRSFKGWMQKTSDFKSFKKLPVNARKYIQFLEKQLGLPVKFPRSCSRQTIMFSLVSTFQFYLFVVCLPFGVVTSCQPISQRWGF